MAGHPKVMCVGRLYCDLIFTDLPRMPTAGTEVYAGGVGLHAGGGAAITAGHLSALGHSTALAAHLPAAAIGDVVARELEHLGVDLRLCQASKEPCEPQLTVALVHNGERAFVTHRAGPAFPNFSVEDAVQLRAAHIHIGEAATLVDNPQLINIAKTVGATLSLDCSWDDHLDARRLARLLPGIDVFLPNESEAQLIRELGVPEPFSKLTVVKKGKNGASALTAESEFQAATTPVEDTVDTTGAGDAFNAAFLSAWLDNQPIEACLTAGNEKGAEAVRYRGGLSWLSPAIALQDITD